MATVWYIAATTVLLLAFSLFRRWSRLRHIPGPLLASLTDLWSFFKIWRGEHYVDFIERLHLKYGPVVRWGPNRVSFAQPAAIQEIYGTAHVYPKASSYNPMTVVSNGQEIASLITIKDEKRVTEIKRLISGGFSAAAWLKQEDQLDSTVELIVDRLRSKSGEVVPLNKWLSLWSFDTLTTLAFSKTRGYLEHEKDLDNVFSSGMARFIHWRAWGSMPTLESALFKNRLVERLQSGSNTLAQLAFKLIQERKAGDKMETGRDLLGRYLAASQEAPSVIAPKDVLALTISTIHAGSATPAIIISSCFTFLFGQPDTFQKLEAEILDAELAFPPSFATVDKLPYLDAVMRETLRYALNPNVTERTVSPTSAIICGTHIPVGTDISTSDGCISRDATLFGPDAAEFKPERWLGVDEQKLREMDRASMAFSYGRRVCIGRHLAMIEMKKLVAGLIHSFRIEPVSVGLGVWDGVTEAIDPRVKLRPRT